MAREIRFGSRSLPELSLQHEINVDPRTGSAQLSVSVPVTPGRGTQPSLALTYGTSAGNSPFGIGWSLSGAPSIALSFEDGLPRYDGSEKYSAAGQPLVRWFDSDMSEARVDEEPDHWVHIYRPRVTPGNTRFEKWVSKRTGRIHWRARDASGAVSVFGFDESGRSRIADGERVSEWLLEWQLDVYGNAIHYQYAPENGIGISTRDSYEVGRLRRGIFAQRYLTAIRYGNAAPLQATELHRPTEWRFSVVFDYGERSEDPSQFEVATPWRTRPDPFSNYRAGFEVRTYRLCRQILMFHHFPDELGEAATLVGAMALDHKEDPAGSTLRSLGFTGFRRDLETGERARRSLPPLVFRYTQPEVERSFVAAPREAHEDAPSGFGGRHQMVDVFGDGLAGILTEEARAWYYKPNLGGGRFGPQRLVLERPAVQLGSYALSDFDGDGNLNLVVLQGREAGHYELDRNAGRWSAFRSFTAAPSVRTLDANTQLIDLDGDGRADIVTVDQDRLIWYRSKGKEGFEASRELTRPRTNGVSQAPIIGPNPLLEYFFADMSGDGLPDQVRIRNGSVEYWPQLGNGHFGEGVVMEGAPVFDFDGAFDPRRIRLVDLDGSGTADIVYIGRGEIRYWINASGNRFAPGGLISGLPFIDQLDSASVIDFLGDGTQCLVWSTARPGHGAAPIQYLRLTGGVKPRLLESVDNSMGKATNVTYGHSSRHYLRDVTTGRGWVTKLPSHVTVVDRFEVVDQVGNTRFESFYEYHDGSFDGEERAFRGFGLVDRYDSDVLRGSDDVPDDDRTAPMCVRTWFHNGAAFDHRPALDAYRGDPRAAELPGPLLEDVERYGPEEITDAMRALAGQVTRTEVFGLREDGARQAHPYQVMQASFRIRRLQGKRDDDDACFAVFESETLVHQYEQHPDDPRITHALTLAVDRFGNVTRSAAVAYPRRAAQRIGIGAQERPLVTVTESDLFNVDEQRHYHLGVPRESRTYEIGNLELSEENGTDAIVHVEAFSRDVETMLRPHNVLRFDEGFGSTPAARLLSWERQHYWNDDRTAVLPWREVGMFPMLHHVESASLTDELVSSALGDRVTPSMLRGEGLYRQHDGHWWVDGPTMHYHSADRFSLLEREVQMVWRDGGAVEAVTRYDYDDPHWLQLTRITDAVGNRVEARLIDYQIVAPSRIMDANDNISEVRYDPLGVAIASTQYGQIRREDGVEVPFGDEPLDRWALLEPRPIEEVIADPARFLQGASTCLHYELGPWTVESPQPPRTVYLVRESHIHDGLGGIVHDGRVQIEIAYVDGFGRPLQTKQLVDPGPVSYTRDAEGRVVLAGPDPPEVDVRWRSSGHAVYDNKQQVIRQYEPYFSPTYELDSDEALRTFGVSTAITYDPVGRQIGALYPNRTEARVDISPWRILRHDPNDTVAGTLYERDRESLADDDPEKLALQQARLLANTPTEVHIDPRGREIVTVEGGASHGSRRTETVLDITGSPIALIDARLRHAFTYQRDMVGRVLHEHSIDAGDRWVLSDALDQRIHVWDGGGAHLHTEYDPIGRARRVDVTDARGRSFVAERMVYGDDPETAEAATRNLRGRLVQHHDQAGVATVHRCDPAGNPLHKERQLAVEFRHDPDWTDPSVVSLDRARFESRFRYDALGRPTWQQLPDSTNRRITYQRGGGVGSVRVTTVDGSVKDFPFLAGAVYNARGQRTEAMLGDSTRGSAIVLQAHYDRVTHRLATLFARERTLRGSGRIYQDLRYAYDPVGNLVHSVDLAQRQPAGDFLAGLPSGVHSGTLFVYDAFYQLREAWGRVHRALEQNDDQPRNVDAGWIKGSRYAPLNDLGELRRYRRRYHYDDTGNLQEVIHTRFGLPGHPIEDQWSRTFSIAETSNRSVPGEVADLTPYFDANGNVTTLSHLRGLEWNYRHNLARAVIIRRTAPEQQDDAEYYIYASDGMRVRKVSERLQYGRMVATEKVYLDGCEIVRTHDADRVEVDRFVSDISDGTQRIALLHRWADGERAHRIHFQLANHLGSASLEVNERGDVLSYEEYFPFGGTAFIAGRSELDVSFKEYRYIGKERDDSTSLYYYGHRYYAPWTGKWLSPDPLGPVDGLNLYQFVRNNPVNLTDPDGLSLLPSNPTEHDLQEVLTRGGFSQVGSPAPWREGFQSEYAAHGFLLSGSDVYRTTATVRVYRDAVGNLVDAVDHVSPPVRDPSLVAVYSIEGIPEIQTREPEPAQPPRTPRVPRPPQRRPERQSGDSPPPEPEPQPDESQPTPEDSEPSTRTTNATEELSDPSGQTAAEQPSSSDTPYYLADLPSDAELAAFDMEGWRGQQIGDTPLVVYIPPFELAEPQPYPTGDGEGENFWDRGPGTLATGLGLFGAGILALLLISGPVGWIAAMGIVMAFAAGLALTTLGVIQTSRSFSGNSTPEDNARVNRAASLVSSTASPFGLAGAGIGAVATGGDEEGIRLGARWGNLVPTSRLDLALTLGGGTMTGSLEGAELGATLSGGMGILRTGTQGTRVVAGVLNDGYVPAWRYRSRLAPDIDAPPAEHGSWYSLGDLDLFLRPTGIEAVISPRDLMPPAPRRMPRTLPGGHERGIGYEMTHLGARELGFPDDPRNLVSASGQTNRFLGNVDTRPATMRRIELDVRAAVISGQTVRYRVTPIYDGIAPNPVAIHMQAAGSGPNGIRIDTVIRNWTHHRY